MFTDPTTIEMLAKKLPLHEGEEILWYRHTDYGYTLCVRTHDGFEEMHDVYRLGESDSLLS